MNLSIENNSIKLENIAFNIDWVKREISFKVRMGEERVEDEGRAFIYPHASGDGNVRGNEGQGTIERKTTEKYCKEEKGKQKKEEEKENQRPEPEQKKLERVVEKVLDKAMPFREKEKSRPPKPFLTRGLPELEERILKFMRRRGGETTLRYADQSNPSTDAGKEKEEFLKFVKTRTVGKIRNAIRALIDSKRIEISREGSGRTPITYKLVSEKKEGPSDAGAFEAGQAN